MNIAHEWGRFVWWLNANSGAVQAATAVLALGITMYLVRFSRRAVTAAEESYKAAQDQFNLGQRQFHLSEQQFELTQQQLASSLKPVVILNLNTGMIGTGTADGRQSHHIWCDLCLRNGGSLLMKLKHLYVVVQAFANFRIDRQYAVEFATYQQRVLMPGEEIDDTLQVELELHADKDGVFGLRIECCDLAEITTVSYMWHPAAGMRQANDKLEPIRVLTDYVTFPRKRPPEG